MHNHITIHGARTHNLKNINIKIPKNKLVVVTGPSGSGKSSLAFDTVYIEGQRRYIESLSSYAKQFINQFSPPDVDSISGLSPTLAIDQKTINKNPRSTVGTITEIHDYLRLLYSKIGTQHCPSCGEKINPQTQEQIVASIEEEHKGQIIEIWGMLAQQKKGEFKNELLKLSTEGIYRLKLNGVIVDIDDQLKIDKNKKNDILVFIDKLSVKENSRKRISESVEFALRVGKGRIIVSKNSKTQFYGQNSSCLKCNISFPELDPKLFSFNSPLGACPKCNGLGVTNDFDLDIIFPDKSLPLNEGGMSSVIKKNSFFYQMLKCVAKEEGVSLSQKTSSIPKKFMDILIYGSEKRYKYSFSSDNSSFNFQKEFPGIINWLNKKLNEGCSEKVRNEINKLTNTRSCQSCKGHRLKKESLHVLINGTNISFLCDLSIESLAKFFKEISVSKRDFLIGNKILSEINTRISFLLNVGLSYLTLNRSAITLSGGESQRIRLATQIGTGLTGVTYVLDEPSIGLHSKDNMKLIKTLKELSSIGNTVLVVEHDDETILAADHIIEIGKGAGQEGGAVTFEGTVEKLKKSKKSLTGKFLTDKTLIPTPKELRKPKQFIELIGANENNIKDVNFSIPLECFVAITGVSGSGKSTFIHNILVPAIRGHFSKNNYKTATKNYKNIEHLELINNIVELDQSPIGRTPKSNPATYCGVFDHIRKLFAETKESRIRGHKPGRFSFNTKGGRCETCEGNGQLKIEMHFLADVFIPCNSCNGKRYNEETLSIYYRGKNISDILQASVKENLAFFENHPTISHILKQLINVGLGYMPLGQPATTLSGGEAQRLKLAKELAKNTKDKCLYVLDEPTTGLHFKDIKILLEALNNLVEQQHSVLIIEHNMDIIKNADYIIDLGPEGGDKGGEIVFSGPSKELIKHKKSYTGKFLKKYL